MSKSKLTAEELRTVSIAKVGASCDDEALIKIIERLSGEKIEAADKRMNRLDPKAKTEFRG